MASGNIFISYRREDSAAYAGRLCDHLTARFGDDRVFMDVDDVAPGERFTQTIDRTIESCEAALVIIGPRWMEILRRRAEQQQTDYVRHEIEAVLARGIAVIPVLVGGATMAQLTGLPERLAHLTLHNAAELRDSTFKEDCARLTDALEQRGLPVVVATSGRKKRLLWAGAATVVLALLIGILAGIGPWKEYRARQVAINEMLATARSQTQRTEYESSFRTYQSLLRLDPQNRAAKDLQVGAAMSWLQNFRVIGGEGQKIEEIAGGRLAEIIAVLDEGLARTNGQSAAAADILAHLGWAHWLNQRMAFKEFGSAAERDLRRALTIDPSNVYGHTMLGNWLLQTHGDANDAYRHFELALKTGRERELVRRMQLGGMISTHEPEVRSALVRVANDMRLNREAMDKHYSHRILSYFHPGLNSADELKAILSALPSAQTWDTFLWLEAANGDEGDSDGRTIRRDFIQASLLENDGKKMEALAAFTRLEGELKKRRYQGRIASHVSLAIKRLSQ